MKNIEERVADIELRNQRVELDKTWETSWQRRTLLVVMTYIVMIIFMWSISVDQPYIQALIPTLGFFLSTLTLSWAKERWRNKK